MQLRGNIISVRWKNSFIQKKQMPSEDVLNAPKPPDSMLFYQISLALKLRQEQHHVWLRTQENRSRGCIRITSSTAQGIATMASASAGTSVGRCRPLGRNESRDDHLSLVGRSFV